MCTLGTLCPGFQRDPVNPALCRHCLHERKQHDAQHNAKDPRVTLAYLGEVMRKLEISVDCSEVRDIDKGEELAELLDLEEGDEDADDE